MKKDFWQKAFREVLIHLLALAVFISFALFLGLFFRHLNGAILGVALWILFCFCYLLVTDEAKDRFWDNITEGR